ncbi:MAG: membrane protein insertase YidC [Alphaproteobacteria bacterium]|nr:membrane protein insertase YidC [Alphaproteobacteria bacterium SS10]
MPDQRNLILAVVLSVLVILGFHFFYEQPRREAIQAQQERMAAEAELQQEQQQRVLSDGDLPTPDDVAPVSETIAAGAVRDRTEVIAETDARLKINTARLHGSINLVGGRIDDLTLADYHETVERKREVALLSPAGSDQPYYANLGWITQDDGVTVPDDDSVWTVVGDSGTELTPDTPITLQWYNGAGLTFERRISVDEDYLFTVEQSVINTTDAAVTLFPYSLAARRNLPAATQLFILHEGPLGVFDGKLTERGYDALRDEAFDGNGRVSERFESDGGWIGITDKYWLVSLIPDTNARITGRINYRDTRDQFQVDLLGQGREIAAGETVSVTSHIFAGAKEVTLLDRYSEVYGIPRFDRAVDFGWFYFLTKPFFYGLDFLFDLLGNFGLAILGFTVLLKLVFFPLANKSYKSMSKLRQIQPRMLELREKYEDDKMRLQQEMMKLYKEEGVNPLSGCLPILIQIPVFFALYKVLFVTIEMRHAPFYGWITDLSVPDPTSHWNLFGLLPIDSPGFLAVGIWPILMGITMWLQMRLNPTPPDPIQQKVFMFMPIIFTFLLATFPAGLVIYWTWNNVLSIIQQSVIMHRMGVKVTFFGKDKPDTAE